MIIDTHSHCYWGSLEPRIDEIIQSMQKYSIDCAVQIGCDILSSDKAIILAKDYPDVFRATVGLHPTDAQKHSFSEIEEIIQGFEQRIIQSREYIVAIGETGLDYHYLGENTTEQKERQFFAWEKQAELARKYHLPLIIHTRDAQSDTVTFIKEHQLENIIMHCYSENTAFARDLLDYSDSVYFSFSGILTYSKATHIQEAASSIPLDRILIETDAPFLAPQAVRGTVNEPANVRYVLEKLCALRPEPADVIEQTIYENSKRIYGL